jgi:hypothetical protein
MLWLTGRVLKFVVLNTKENLTVLFLSVSQRFQLMSDTAGNMLQSLGHCLSLFEQQEEVYNIIFNCYKL